MTRVMVLHHEVPVPPRHGGTLDVWWRLQALRALGLLPERGPAGQ